MRTTRKLPIGVGTVVAIIAALLAMPAEVAAQDNKAQVYHVDPEPGFEAAWQDHAEWRTEHGESWDWSVYQVVQGEHLGDFIIRSGGHSWSEFDTYNEGFGERAGQHFSANVAQLVEDGRNYIVAVDTALMRLPEDMEQPQLVSVDTYYLTAGGAQDWWDAAEKFHEAIAGEDAAGYRYALLSPEAGASGWARVVDFHENWASFAPPERSFEELMQSVYGEEQAQEIFDRFSSSFHRVESMVVRYRPDLSVEAADDEGGQ